MATPGGVHGSEVSVARVVAVVVDLADGRQQVGSGYLVGPRLVLTAGHCTRDKRTGGAMGRLRVVRASDGRATMGTVTAASEALDVAVVELDEPLGADDLTPPRYGRVERGHARELTGCVALGYPLFQLDPTDRTRALAEIHGVIRVTEDFETGRLVLRDPMLTTVTAPSTVAADDRRPDSPWGGLSGAVVFHEDLALGVIVEHHPRQGASSVRLLPFDRLLSGPDTAALAAVLGLGAGLADVAPPPSRPAVVDTLVPPPAVLVGRTHELAQLRAAIPAVDGTGQRAVVAVHGMGGVGKSALARAFAAEVARRFPDARLEVDLHGFTPGATPRPTGEVLGEVLGLVGFGAADVPAGTEGRSQLWRSWLSPRRVLLVLDNARNVAQVEPLLPGGTAPGRSLVLVTSRSRLDELDPTVTVGVATLPAADAVDLLVRASRRPPAELESAQAELDALADRCGHLPLALRPVGNLLDRLDPAELLQVITAASPLEHLSRADQATSAAFAVSYDALTPGLQDTLRASAWHPGPDFDGPSIAALTDAPQPLATVQLLELHDASMLVGLPERRYALHDLFLDYARRQADAQDAPEAVREARHRLYAHLHRRVETAAALVFTDNRHAATPPHDRSGFRNRDHARAWLSAAADELITSANAALADGWPGAVTFAHRLARWLHAAGRPDPAGTLFGRAAQSARAAGSRREEAEALAGLGMVSHARGESSEARDACQRALDLYRDIDDWQGQADALRGLGDVARLRGELSSALDAYRRAHDLYDRAGDRRGQADSLEGVGDVAALRGELDDAHDAYQRSHDLAVEIGYRSGQADAFCGLADVRQGRSQHDQARLAYERAHDIYLDIGNIHGLAYALKGLGDVDRLQGRYDQARDNYGKAVDLYQEIGFRNRQADCLNGLGHIAAELADDRQAEALHWQAHDISHELGYRSGQAEALEGLANVALGRGEHQKAHERLQEADEIRRQIESS
jgi:tetratricopeptide (TPR) repeat protein